MNLNQGYHGNRTGTGTYIEGKGIAHQIHKVCQHLREKEVRTLPPLVTLESRYGIEAQFHPQKLPHVRGSASQGASTQRLH